MSLAIQRYTEKSIVVRGDTKARINDLKSINGAKFGYYGGEPGWMFPQKMEDHVRAVLGVVTPYCDGPKPNPKPAPHYYMNTQPAQAVPIGVGVAYPAQPVSIGVGVAQSLPSDISSYPNPLLAPSSATTTAPPSRGLRGPPPVDEEVVEMQLKQMIEELRKEVLAKNEVLQKELESVKEKNEVLQKEIDTLKEFVSKIEVFEQSSEQS